MLKSNLPPAMATSMCRSRSVLRSARALMAKSIALVAVRSPHRPRPRPARKSKPTRVFDLEVFVASDNEALTWQPGQRSEFGGDGSGVRMQDRVEVGDMSVGVTYERNGVQASLAYVEREEATTVGNETFSQDQSFAGVTLTMRR